MITLTPGTLVIDISDDRSILYIHAMDIEDAEKPSTIFGYHLKKRFRR